MSDDSSKTFSQIRKFVTKKEAQEPLQEKLEEQKQLNLNQRFDAVNTSIKERKDDLDKEIQERKSAFTDLSNRFDKLSEKHDNFIWYFIGLLVGFIALLIEVIVSRM